MLCIKNLCEKAKTQSNIYYWREFLAYIWSWKYSALFIFCKSGRWINFTDHMRLKVVETIQFLKWKDIFPLQLEFVEWKLNVCQQKFLNRHPQRLPTTRGTTVHNNSYVSPHNQQNYCPKYLPRYKNFPYGTLISDLMVGITGTKLITSKYCEK